jgi:lipopolysaccharide/colanic/teichoic acid biosynthesis glycosyltransferase
VFFVALLVTKSASYFTSLYLQLWSVLIGIRVVAFFYYQKFSLQSLSLKSGLVLIVWANALVGFSTVFVLSITPFSQIPRWFATEFILIPFVLDLLFVWFKSKPENTPSERTVPSFAEAKRAISLIQFTYWLVCVILAHQLVSLIKYRGFVQSIYTWEILALILPAWLLSTLFTQKYHKSNSSNPYLILGQHLKAIIIVVTLLSVPHFFLRMEHLSRALLFGTALISGVFELILALIGYLYTMGKHTHLLSMDDIADKYGIIKQEELTGEDALAENIIRKSNLVLFSKLIAKSDPLEIRNYLFTLAAKNNSTPDKISLISATTNETINLQMHNSILVNLHNCNDQRRLNKYFISCHDSLEIGGLLVGYFEPLNVVNKNLREKLPRILFLFFSPVHFVFHRILPKMRLTCYFYFLLTRGKNRIISKAEIFGRLNYCGFDIIADLPLDDKRAFIAKKTKAISSELKPSFSAIVNLKRIGYKGELIDIFKIRTMHPYSEFLQKYVYENSNLDDSGKFKDDFRLTAWGKLFRNIWIDELPQLYNWVRGDVKLVGVRALSQQYFSIYPEELRLLRVKTKPGLLPPYYVDLPKNFEEILESENNYLHKYFANPIRTDFEYFFKASWNILKGARSK